MILQATYIMPHAQEGRIGDVNNVSDMSNVMKYLPKTKAGLTAEIIKLVDSLHSVLKHSTCISKISSLCLM